MNTMARQSALAVLPLGTPQALGFLQLRADPLFYRIKPAQRLELVVAALADGRHLADQQRERGVKDPWELAARLGVPVRETAGDADFGTTVVCAEYRTRHPRIVLYTRVLERLQAALDDVRGGGPSRVDVKAAFLAHELYHHLDESRGDQSLSRRHRVCLLRLGSWRWTSGVTSLPEIAAGAFAQSLLGLPFHAKLLELFVVLDADAGAAHRYIEALAACGTAFPEPPGAPA
jgi:hypothetical protein